MRFGPHTDAVEAFLTALRDPVVRRRRVPPRSPADDFPKSAAVFGRVTLSRRDEWDDARMTAARVAAPSQRHVAAGVGLALASADLLPDFLWEHFTQGPLGRLVERPGGPLAERCACGMQTGERLVRELRNQETNVDRRFAHGPASGPDCGHVVPALPSPDALAVAFGLVRRWDTPDWDRMLILAGRLAR